MNIVQTQKPRKRNSYHSDVKIAFQLNILPQELERCIPKTTRHLFKKSDYSRLFGSAFTDSLKERLEFAKATAKSNRLFQIYRIYNRIKNTLLCILLSKLNIRSLIKPHKEKIVALVIKAKEVIGLKRVLHYFNLSKSTFYSWLSQVKY
jgi:hypothetical protein